MKILHIEREGDVSKKAEKQSANESEKQNKKRNKQKVFKEADWQTKKQT